MQHASEDTQMSYMVWAQDLVKCVGGMNTLFKQRYLYSGPCKIVTGASPWGIHTICGHSGDLEREC